MPLFLSEEEFQAISQDPAAVAERADAAIRDLRRQLETVKAEADAAAIASEQTCAILEQRYDALSADLDLLRSQNEQLAASSERHASALADAQSEKHQLHLKAIGKDGEIERLSLELAELKKSKRQSLELLEQKDAQITEKNTTIQSYLDKIVVLTNNAAAKETRLLEIETEVTRCHATCNRISQEKELLEKHNSWLDEELKAKSNTIAGMRKSNMDSESKMSARIADLERELGESSVSLKRKIERMSELEQRVSYLEKELSTSKEAAAINEQRLSAELATVSKLVELYKESSGEWSKKAGELEGVIKALETHLTQVEDEYKEKLEKEVSIRTKLEKEAAEMREQLEKRDMEIENVRKSSELSLLPVIGPRLDSTMQELVISDGAIHRAEGHVQMTVPKAPAGISGTALAASLLREGWSLAKMYEQYQDAADALRHERWGRRHAEAVLERVLREIEQKAELILDERAEHERLVEAYSLLNQKLEQSLLEHESFENTIRSLKSELKRCEHDNILAQKEIDDLMKQVSVLLKECQDIQIRCGGTPFSASSMNVEDNIHVSGPSGQRTFRDINGLVEQNVKLQSQVQRLTAELKKKDEELEEGLQIELQKKNAEAASKIEAVLKRSEEQQCLIDSLHTSVALYKRLYEEDCKKHSNSVPKGLPEEGNGDIMLRIENSQPGVSKNEHTQLVEHARKLEEDLTALRSETIALRIDRDKMVLEADFSKERLNSSLMELEHQRKEANAVSARNVELMHLIVDYQKRLRESSDSVQAAEENARKFSMEVSILKHGKDILVNSEKRAMEEVRNLSDKVHRLQSTLDTIQTTEEVRGSARASERQKQADYIKRLEQEWAEAKKELQEEKDRARTLTVEKEKVIETSMKQVEEMRKELSDAWRSVSLAETRAAVAEAKRSDIEGKLRGKGGIGDSIVAASNAVDDDIWKLKEELEKLREDAQANRNYMLQYKEIAQTNEAALKQIESMHEEYKAEAEKSKLSLEGEVTSLRSKLSELEKMYNLQCQEAASVSEEKDKQLFSLGLEISVLKDEISEKMAQMDTMQTKVTSLNDELDREHKRWRIAQDNYERQVIMQAETIQELTNTSKELSILQSELTKLRESLDVQKAANENLKASWDHEKQELQKERDETLRKYNETDEQNKLLHSRLESLHIRLADKEQASAGYSVDSKSESDLQNVISYLRRSKEIAEIEISLLKKEKLRLQSELDIAFRASQDAQALLRSQAENAKAIMFKDEEFKSLQLQVREINLLRESNIQLREENKQNFEECQKLREEAQKAKIEAESSRSLLSEKQIEIEACQKELEMRRMEAESLDNRIKELVESSKIIDPEEHERMKDELHHIKVLLTDHSKEFEQAKNQILEKEEIVSKLEEKLARCQADLADRENKLNDFSQANLRAEIDKQKRYINAIKKKNETLLKDKEDLNKEKEGLSKEKEGLLKEKEGVLREKESLLKQIEELKSSRKSSGESSTDQAVKEKDTRIQMLERTIERERQEKEKERVRRKNGEQVVLKLHANVQTDKKKVEEELSKHKQSIAMLLESTGLTTSQIPSRGALDDQLAAYFHSVTTLESSATSLQEGQGGPSATPEISNPEALQPPARQVTPPPARTSQAKLVERRTTTALAVSRPTEVRKPGRRLVRPALERTEEPPTDIEMAAAEASAAAEEAKTGMASHEHEAPLSSTSLLRKRGASSEPREEPGTQEAALEISEAAAPPQKKQKEDAVCQESAQDTESSPVPAVPVIPASPEIPEVLPEAVVTADDVDELVNAEEMDADQPGGEEVTEVAGEDDSTKKDEMELEVKNQEEEEQPLETDTTVTAALEEGEAEQNIPSGGEEDREEGELPEEPDQPQDDIPGEGDNPESTPTRADEEKDEEILVPPSPEPAAEPGEIAEERSEGAEIADESAKGNEASPVVAPVVQKSPRRIVRLVRGSSSSTVRRSSESTAAAETQGSGPSSTEAETTDGASRGGRTIHLPQRARENAALRQAGISSQPPSSGRGRGQSGASRLTRSRGRGRG